jgi:hypothetical protein
MQVDRLDAIFTELNQLLDRESESIDWAERHIPHDRALEQFRNCEARVDALLEELGGVLRKQILNRRN